MGICHDNKCMGPNHIRYIWTTFVYTSCKGMSCMHRAHIMHVYTCHIYIHIFICRGPLHMCLTCYMIRIPRSSSTCSILPQLRPWHLLPRRRCLLQPLLQPTRIPASLGVALFGVVSPSLYIICITYIYICVCVCVCLFSLKGVFNTKTYIYIYLVKEHPGAGASGSSF